VQQKVKIGTTGLVGVLATCMQKITWIVVYPVVSNSTEEDPWGVGKCGVQQVSNSIHVALCQHMLSLLLLFYRILLNITQLPATET